MLFNLALHLNHHALAAALMASAIFAICYYAKERSDERKRA